MYSVSPVAANAWHRLLSGVARRAGVPANVIDHAPPAPLSDLWNRRDKAAVFMCGLPYSRANPRPELLAAPVPSPAQFDGKPHYWSEFIVRASGPYETLTDTFGNRIAFTTLESQSGYVAPLRYLTNYAAAKPLFRTVIQPRISPLGALIAVIEGLADVAPIDSYAFHLLKSFRPELTAQVRVVGRTEARPIPPLVGSLPNLDGLAAAFLDIHEDSAFAPAMADLSLARFVQPSEESYDILRSESDATADFWRRHRLADEIHPGFVH